jgi:hypothetical protein
MLSNPVVVDRVVKGAFVASLIGGAFAGHAIINAVSPHFSHRDFADVAVGIGAFALVPLSFVIAHPIEMHPGPFRSDAVSNAVEGVSKVVKDLHWGPSATVVGTIGMTGGFGIAAGAFEDFCNPPKGAK